MSGGRSSPSLCWRAQRVGSSTYRPNEALGYALRQTFCNSKGSIARMTLVRNRPLLLIPAFGLLLVAALWSAVLYQLAREERSELATEMRATEALAALFEEHTLGSIRDADRTLLVIKYQIEHSGGVDLRKMTENRLISYDRYILINVLDRNGATLASSYAFDPALRFTDREYFRAHAAGDSDALDISEPLIGKQTGRPSILLTRRLNAPDGSFNGVVAIAVSPAYFTNFYQESILGDHGILALLGTDGVLRARRSGKDETVPPGVVNAPPLVLSKVNPTGSYRSASVVDGVDRLLAYRRLADYPLLVISARSIDEVLADFGRRRQAYLTVTTALTTVILLFFAGVTFLAIRLKRTEKDLQQGKAFLQTLVDNIPVGITVRKLRLPHDGKFVVWNDANRKLFDIPRDVAVGRSIAEVMPPETAALIDEWDRAMLASPMVQEVVETAAMADGGQRILHRVRAPIFAEDDSVDCVITVTKDITREQAAADKLRLASQVFETTADGIVLSDADDRVIMLNSAFTRLTGFTEVDMLGEPLWESPFRPLDPIESAARMEKLHRDGFVTGEVARLHKDGHELTLWVTATSVRGDGGKILNYVRVFTDISLLKDARRKLEQLANVDVLTGLPNRRLFLDRIEQALLRASRAGSSFALLFLDLDGFKPINDAHGHEIGDLLLKEVSRRLQECIRASDSLCRLGGDEFTIVIENARLPEHAMRVGNRILQALSTAIVIRDIPLGIGISIGIALYPGDGSDTTALLSHADIAMYRAKSAGGNRLETFRSTAADVA